MEKSTASQQQYFRFSAMLKNERKNSFNLVKDNEIEKSRIVLAVKRNTSTKRLGDWRKRRNPLFEAEEFGNSNPVKPSCTSCRFPS